MDTSAPNGGLLGSIRSLADSLLGSVQDRLELFALELQEEKARLIQTAVWISAAVFSAMLALTFASLTLVYLFWESARLAVLGGLSLGYLGVFGYVLRRYRRFAERQPRPFAASVEEIERDRTWFNPES